MKLIPRDGAKGVGGWRAARRLRPVRRDILSGCGHRSGSGNRYVLAYRICVTAKRTGVVFASDRSVSLNGFW